jgi:hydroxymethyl cephem carbamoyltransferase
MRILSVKPGHDDSIAYVEDGQLIFSLEAEKGSVPRYSAVTAQLLIDAMQAAPAIPDVLAIGGWHKHIPGYYSDISAGYSGIHEGQATPTVLFGTAARLFSSTHERSHILMACGMHPEAPLERCTVLVWEGTFGAFYEWRDNGRRIRKHHVMSEPGAKYSALFAICDPAFSPAQRYPRPEDAGKLMALAAYGRAEEATGGSRDTVERLLATSNIYPFDKSSYADSPLHDCGVDTELAHHAAALITDRIYDEFAVVARRVADRHAPLVISGGCGLNCDWNERWRMSALFSGVFVPPCANDSGSAIGTAIDAQRHFGGEARLTWSVYSGGEFGVDEEPDAGTWERARLDVNEVCLRLATGEVVAWVQGRCEIGPRALGNRSLLASAADSRMRDKLNALKGREAYRPIAPCCRAEELTRWFDSSAPDPYMLFFSKVRTPMLPAITHVDGTARVQAVARADNARLHELLTVFGDRTGCGVLCNTSLNFPGVGFINRMSELAAYCALRGIRTFVVNNEMYTARVA